MLWKQRPNLCLSCAPHALGTQLMLASRAAARPELSCSGADQHSGLLCQGLQSSQCLEATDSGRPVLCHTDLLVRLWSDQGSLCLPLSKANPGDVAAWLDTTRSPAGLNYCWWRWAAASSLPYVSCLLWAVRTGHSRTRAQQRPLFWACCVAREGRDWNVAWAGMWAAR